MNFIFTINSLIAAIFLFHLSFAQRPCREGNRNQIRNFLSLDELRTTEFPFMVGSARFRGNRVILRGPTFKKLEKKSFICDTCEFIATLNITGHKIEEIEDGAFQNLRCLKDLDMSANDILNIHPETFAELRRLEVLHMKTNNVEVLKNMTFAKNYNLKEIDLTSNYIKYIEYNAFYNLSLLELLHLRDNDLTYLDFDMFQNVPKLQGLYLAFNKLLRIEPPRKVVYNLIDLIDVSQNQLTEGIEHLFLPSIVRIKLTGNKIRKLDVDMLLNNSKTLASIELSDNNWECEELATMEKKLRHHRIIFGQPIMCTRNLNTKYSDYYSPIVLKDQLFNMKLTITLIAITTIIVVIFVCHFVGIHIRERDVCSIWGRFCGENANPGEQGEEIALVAPNPQL